MYSTGRPGTRSAPRRKLHRTFARLVQRMREMLDFIFSRRREASLAMPVKPPCPQWNQPDPHAELRQELRTRGWRAERVGEVSDDHKGHKKPEPVGSGPITRGCRGCVNPHRGPEHDALYGDGSSYRIPESQPQALSSTWEQRQIRPVRDKVQDPVTDHARRD